MELTVVSCHAEYDSKKACEEQAVLAELFSRGLDTFHFRKPTYSITEMRAWMDALPQEYHSKIVVHSFHDLALEYELKGIHLTTRQRTKCMQSKRQVEFLMQKRPELELSTSFHDLDELRFAPSRYRYVFLSPIYDSISKPHYRSNFEDHRLLGETVKMSRNHVYALGGITGDKIDEVRTIGFQGVALLGAIWRSDNPVQSFEEIQAKCQSLQNVCSA